MEQSRNHSALSEPAVYSAPTGGLIPDGLGGELLSVRWAQNPIGGGIQGSPDELVYRIDENGDVVFKFPLPRYEGRLHDEMVLGEDDIGFTTRGSQLIAFNVRIGKELWHWDSGSSDIEVFAALANGHCLVQSPTELLEVENASRPKSVLKGKAMMGGRVESI